METIVERTARQAMLQAHDWLSAAHDIVHVEFKNTTEEQKTQLIVALLSAAAQDQLGMFVYTVSTELHRISLALTGMEENFSQLRTDHPLQGETLAGIEESLAEIADSIRFVAKSATNNG